MARIIWRQRAIEDLNAIWEYTFTTWSESQADVYYNAIKFACKEIAANPLLGKVYAGISKDLLGLKSGKHIIFYHVVSENEIEIIRILHERMDLKNRIN
ncbi:type II toxin-antitoxin system RelE/ParE family toxin [Flagellimonas myxillae]|uniref:type II toxin-antitoxin system RelE/ParE family toxin n=1 Tax=Flagellimonas myxillae TaxID=2942214 RepID=UPI00201FB17F|nr:type II toxin-antitoxin system RelE/ParE family toxin [Muricauda myxillae]MCL6266615.1 type II toxin-antitoxin system RelE/ParE family toxin [Muricauda myxillae]